MELKRRDGNEVFSGSGTIRQNERRELVFNLLDTQYGEGVKTAIEECNKHELSAGQIIPMGNYYDLQVTDNSDKTWRSLPTFNVNRAYGPNKGVVFSGKIRELWHIENHAELANKLAKAQNVPATSFFKQPYWDYYCFSDIGRLPCNASVENSTRVAGRETKKTTSFSVSRAESDMFVFELHKDEGMVQFLVQGKDDCSYSDNIEYCFVEALQFVLGSPFDWEVMVICSGNIEEVGIRPLPTGQQRIKMLPPLTFDTHKYCKEFWQLYQKYLTYIISYTGKGWHPISRRVFTMQHGMSALWPIQMLVAGVEIDGLLNDQFDNMIPPPPAIKQSVDEVLGLIEDYKIKGGAAIDDDSLSRIKNSLGRLSNSTSARNKLRKLVAESVIRDADVESWNFVRNKAAHAVDSEMEISQDNTQHLNRVLVLFYHLIFHRIGYQGIYNDYGELKYPIKTYPP